MAGSVDVSGIGSFAEQYDKQIILQALLGLAKQGIFIDENVSTSKKYPKYIVQSGLQPYSPTFTGEGSLVLSDRELTTKPAKDEYLIDAFEFEDTYLRLNRKDATLDVIPYENYFWQQVAGRVTDKLITSVIWKGDTDDVSTNKAIRICDGLEKILAQAVIDGDVTPVVTGALTSSNAVGKMELVYSTAMAAQPALISKPMIIYCSPTNRLNYKLNYRSSYPQDGDPETYENGVKTLYLKLAEQPVEIKAVDWLAGSNKLILSPADNLIMGTNKMSDMNTLKVVPDVWTQKIGLRFVVGLQIRDTEVLFANDAA
ncbi:MAG: hypothetical protein JSS76_08355 [Bacteroidetes bacterium]|nr:hypothetical protein [Bacteroidota bacterium]